MIRKRSDRPSASSLGSAARNRRGGKYALLQGRRDRARLLPWFRDTLKKWASGWAEMRTRPREGWKRTQAPVQPIEPARESQGAGGLALAVVGLLASAVVMAALTVRLADQPDATGKQARQQASTGKDASGSDDPWRRPSESAGKSATEPAQPVTFYNDLTVPETPTPANCEPSPTAPGTPDEMPGPKPSKAQADTSTQPGPKPTASSTRKEGQATRKGSLKQTCPSPAAGPAQVTEPVHQAPSGKRFTVQVGTFAHPSVAREWAGKWKERGYDVILKPVARPKSGVIYRLYLGSFDAEKDADELIRQLKAKEGVNAFRVSLI